MERTNWLTYAVPRKYVGKYLVTMWIALFIVPQYIFGLYYTKLGIIVNIVWYDVIFYMWLKFKKND
jgi:hypothetical protein